ncbi:D-alanyl-D-alanine-carboxypeptidase/endopeptidase AmpH precursor [Corynebacterium atrinae]|uniref:serine hydrolase domain-containing protein n=1 Tax=Corynebacterium atrinae TaxID=1336740 RepID=UPI0025B61D8A|nr:serine hydrolase domain-containing protein [Corynebacterium atrinae]WJY63179.1 D-alanyl-D-alanine-carboxypeptidase/endopeptidase AmpH precursor [Corynebacterium atrinae]
MRIVLSILAGLAVLAAAIVVGPSKVTVSDERTGDPALAASLAEHAQRGHHHLSAFTMVGDDTTFAGLGADENTEYEIGSITKTFTAELLARTDDSQTVGEIIDVPGAPIADVTLRELADHTSGLPRLGKTNVFRDIYLQMTAGNPYAGHTRDELLAEVADSELSQRGEFNYSNLGSALLGHLLAMEAGTTYEELLHDVVLGPSGMDDSYLMTFGSVPPDAPRGFNAAGREAEPWEMDSYLPAGGLRSTATDMARYARHATVPDVAWVVREDGSRAHNGGTFGYSSILIVDRATNKAVYVVGDTDLGVEDIAYALWGSI